jgi:hypothetical protein
MTKCKGVDNSGRGLIQRIAPAFGCSDSELVSLFNES